MAPGTRKKRLRPAAIEKAAREEFLRHRRRDAERDHQQPQRAVGARRFQHSPMKPGRDLAAESRATAVPAHDQNDQRDGADHEIAARRSSAARDNRRTACARADRDPQRQQHRRQPHDHGERNRQAAADDVDRGGHIESARPATAQNQTITAIWPTNIAAKMNRPHSACPRTSRPAAGARERRPSEARRDLSGLRESIRLAFKLDRTVHGSARSSRARTSPSARSTAPYMPA